MNLMLHTAALLVLLLCIQQTDWKLFRQSTLLQHLSLGGIAVLTFIWSLSAKLDYGLSIHFLGITTLTLMLGLRRALLAGAVVVLLNQFINDYDAYMVSTLYLSHVVVPALLTFISYAVIYHRLPRHPFVYIFVNAFLTGALAIAFTHLAHGSWALLSGYLSWDNIWQNYGVITPLLMFPEALLNGMAVTLMVVYRPHWLKTFSDEVYLDNS
ncbi:hypothetical protein C5610_07240 [Idiomarina sp. OT37-5b]|uniref:energy-coupling factor ABC transporter permease n=1 Tax=Idiomarina sp. OT37-5b TaxID=2100422 RepID=UPI000CFA29A6|nr:energy-coupling factor ABC transporter permease [Idiomarina sp. OT37-5b]AVJ56125.1 hypothetical protein C5610_07240 [Idiomarina sp. OT37-5b]